MNEIKNNIANTQPKKIENELTRLKPINFQLNKDTPKVFSEIHCPNIQDCPWYEQDILTYLKKAECRSALPRNFLNI